MLVGVGLRFGHILGPGGVRVGYGEQILLPESSAAVAQLPRSGGVTVHGGVPEPWMWQWARWGGVGDLRGLFQPEWLEECPCTHWSTLVLITFPVLLGLSSPRTSFPALGNPMDPRSFSLSVSTRRCTEHHLPVPPHLSVSLHHPLLVLPLLTPMQAAAFYS